MVYVKKIMVLKRKIYFIYKYKVNILVSSHSFLLQGKKREMTKATQM